MQTHTANIHGTSTHSTSASPEHAERTYAGRIHARGRCCSKARQADKTSEGSRPAVKAGDAGMREVKTGEQRRASIGGQLRGAAGEGCT